MFYFATPHYNAYLIWSQLVLELGFTLNDVTRVLQYENITHKHPDEEPPKYLITEEISKYSHQDVSGHHFHIIADMTEKQYNNYSKRIISKLGLRGNAALGLARQYGKVKIKELDKALSYVLKDNGTKYTNFTQEQIQEFYDKSFKKDESRDIRKEIIKRLIEVNDTPVKWIPLQQETDIGKEVWAYDAHAAAYAKWQEQVITFLIQEKAPVVSKTQIENIIKQFVQQSVTIPLQQKINLLILLNKLQNPFKSI